MMTAQDLLWMIPSACGGWWNVLVSALAAPACVITFLWMVHGQRWSSLLFARLLMLGGFVCFALIPLNSGWLPWGALLTSAGGLLTSVLIATDWCNRPDKTVKMHTALGRWLFKVFDALVAFITGPKCPYDPTRHL